MDVQQWTGTLAEALGRVTQTVLAYSPSILGFLALVIIGWVVAWVLRAITHGLAARALQRLARMKRFRARFEQSDTYRATPVVVSRVVFWTVLLFFVAAAIEALGLPAVSRTLGVVTAYLPRILLGVLIVFVGVWTGEYVRSFLVQAAARAGIPQGDVVGRVAQTLVVFVGVIIAVEQVGIDSTVLVTILVTVFGITFGATALAFGLGARSAVSNIIAAHYVRKVYRVGDPVRIGDIEGHITEITQTAVLLNSPEGRVMVPTQRFNEEVSVLRRAGG